MVVVDGSSGTDRGGMYTLGSSVAGERMPGKGSSSISSGVELARSPRSCSGISRGSSHGDGRLD